MKECSRSTDKPVRQKITCRLQAELQSRSGYDCWKKILGKPEFLETSGNFLETRIVHGLAYKGIGPGVVGHRHIVVIDGTAQNDYRDELQSRVISDDFEHIEAIQHRHPEIEQDYGG